MIISGQASVSIGPRRQQVELGKSYNVTCHLAADNSSKYIYEFERTDGKNTIYTNSTEPIVWYPTGSKVPEMGAYKHKCRVVKSSARTLWSSQQAEVSVIDNRIVAVLSDAEGLQQPGIDINDFNFNFSQSIQFLFTQQTTSLFLFKNSIIQYSGSLFCL